MPNLSLAIIDSDSHARQEVAGILGTFGNNLEILASANFEDGMRRIEESQPQIVILDVREIARGAKETSAIISRSPQSAVFVTCDQKNPDWILRLIRAGAGEYLTKPVNAVELVDAVKKVTRLHQRGVVQKGRAIAVYNPAGGVGTTTIAANLAATLQSRGEKVALVDLNLLTADVATCLDLSPRYTLADVMSRSADLDGSLLKSLMVAHSSGLHVLPGPARLVDPNVLQPELVHKLLAVLKGLFSYTVVDTGGQLSPSNRALFLDCDQVLYATVLSLPGLKNAKLYLATLDALALGPDRVKLVVNRFQPKGDISLASAEKVLNTKVFATLPNVYAEATGSTARGEPLVRSFPRSPIVRATGEMTDRLLQGLTASRRTAAQKEA